MSERTYLHTKGSAIFSSKARGLLQRACACGQQKSGEGHCERCPKKQVSTLHRAPINAAAMHDESYEQDQSRDPSKILTESRFGQDFSSLRAHTSPQNVKVPGAPVNEFEDCPLDWQKKADAALVLARDWVTNVVTGLTNLTYPYPPAVAYLLNRHFHITGRGYAYEVKRHFNTIYSALNSPIDFECEKKCDAGVAAYVYRVWSDVHLCPLWYNNLDIKGKANTLIHEIAHDAADRDDEAYIWQPEYQKLSAEDAIDNADSYSNFAEESFGP